jgi:vancomycin resistance protein VanJ
MSLLAEAHGAPSSATSRRSPGRRTLNAAVVLLSLLLALTIAFHTWVPDVLGLGFVIDSAAPWLGIGIPMLLLLALIARRGRAWVAVLAPTLAWCLMFGASIVPLSWTAPAASASTLTVASQNVQAGSGTGADSAADLAATGA